MNGNRCRYLWDNILGNAERVMGAKARDYTGDDDRLANFRRRAQVLEVETPAVVAGDLTKHVDCLVQAAISPERGGAWSWETRDGGEGLKQRIADSINYLLLLAAAFEERERPGEQTASDIGIGGTCSE